MRGVLGRQIRDFVYSGKVDLLEKCVEKCELKKERPDEIAVCWLVVKMPSPHKAQRRAQTRAVKNPLAS